MIKAIQWLAGTKASGFLPIKAEKRPQNRNEYFLFSSKRIRYTYLTHRARCPIFKRIQDKIHAKPDLSGPKNSFESVISYQQDTNWTLKTEWPSAWDTRPWPPSGRAGKRRRKGAGTPCRENGTQYLKLRWYAKPEPIVPILPWNSLHIF